VRWAAMPQATAVAAKRNLSRGLSLIESISQSAERVEFETPLSFFLIAMASLLIRERQIRIGKMTRRDDRSGAAS